MVRISSASLQMSPIFNPEWGQAGCPAGHKTSHHEGIRCASYSLSIPGVVITAVPLPGFLDRFLHMASPALLCPQQHLLVVFQFLQSLLCGTTEFPAVYLGGKTGLVSSLAPSLGEGHSDGKPTALWSPQPS